MQNKNQLLEDKISMKVKASETYFTKKVLAKSYIT